MKKKLILITDYYPYTQNETFLESEIPYLSEAFELSIVSADTVSECVRNFPKDIKVYRCTGKSGFSIFDKIRLFLEFVFSIDGIIEIFTIIKKGKKIHTRFLSSLYYFMQGQSYYERLVYNKIINKRETQIIYSYWSTYRLLGITHNAKKLPNTAIITRLHGYDLYNERMKTGMQPFKSQMEKRLSKVILVADFCRDYYLKNFCIDTTKVEVMRLGSLQEAILNYKESDEIFTIVSCSNVIPLKRVDLIANAISQINSIRIKWIHFGDGYCMESLKSIISSMSSNIEAILMGRISNEEVRNYYLNNNIDCFITTSETEGCPVSIMEALSFGIPIIATPVGGIPEMIGNTKNILLSKDPNIIEVVQALHTINNLSNDIRKQIFDENISIWSEKYNIVTNTRKLVTMLNQL